MDLNTAIAIVAMNIAWAWYSRSVQRSLMDAHRESLGMVGNLVAAAVRPPVWQVPEHPATLPGSPKAAFPQDPTEDEDMIQ